MTTTELRTGHLKADIHKDGAGAAHLPLVDHECPDVHCFGVDEAHSPKPTNPRSATIGAASVRAQTSPASKSKPTPTAEASPGISDSVTDHICLDVQKPDVGDASVSPAPAKGDVTPIVESPVLVDHHLAVLANRVNDLENFRKASANQLDALTRVGADKDGEARGYELPAGHPAVVQSQAIVDAIQKIEDQTVKQLEKKLKSSPLGPWVLSQKGIGFKTVARLLAATGDPYWNGLHDRPRTVSELWAYCGYRPGQRKQKGEQVNWSPEAKMRAFNCIDPVKQQLRKPCMSLRDDDGNHVGAEHVDGCQCSPYRVIYDEAKAKYVGSIHSAECPRCSGKGKLPAEVGSPRKAAHIDQMAVRYATKILLKNLWREAKRLHELPGDHHSRATHAVNVVGVSNSSAGQSLADAHFYSAGGGPT